MITNFSWSWTTFFIGSAATLAFKFLKELRINKKQKKVKQEIIKNWSLDDLGYIILGGLFTVAMDPSTVLVAIINGASFEALFMGLIKTK